MALVVGRADGLPPRLRRLVRRRHPDRGASTRRRPTASRTRARSAAELYGGVPATLDALREGAAGGPDRSAWIAALREAENEKRAGEQDELTDERAPLHPLRVYHELRQVLDRDAVVIGDGGDFVSYAGRVIDTYEPGCWMDPGPFGCLGAGPGLRAGGQARAAPTARSACCWATAPSASPAWSSTRSCATASRWSAVMGNNGIWALEKHPMEFLYGYSVAAELQPECRYDQVVEALGGHGELVRAARRAAARAGARVRVGQAGAGERAHRPAVAYPRKSNLA